MGEIVQSGSAIERQPYAARYVNEKGEVAVLVSPGFGAGWASWCYDEEPNARAWLLFAPELVELVLAGHFDVAAALAEAHFDGNFYAGGARDLRIEWVPAGKAFLLREYDGAESLQFTVEAYVP